MKLWARLSCVWLKGGGCKVIAGAITHWLLLPFISVRDWCRNWRKEDGIEEQIEVFLDAKINHAEAQSKLLFAEKAAVSPYELKKNSYAKTDTMHELCAAFVEPGCESEGG